MARVLLCTTTESLMHPELLGLEESDLAALPWLVCEADAQAARTAASAEDIGEVWVEGSDDMDALNLAAAICQDQPGKPVGVVASQASGSLRSRAQAAGVNAIISADGLIQRFFIEKERRARMTEVGARLEQGWNAADAALPVEQDVPETEAVRQATPSGGSFSGPEQEPTREPQPQPQPISMRDDRPSGAVRAGCVLAVLSGSGGAGKSTISAIAASVAAAKGNRVLLFDGDLQFGDAAHLCGAADAVTADDVLEDPSRLARLAEGLGEEGMALLAAPARLEQAEVVTANMPQLLERAAALFEVVVVNTGASWTDAHAAIIERSDRALFLVDQKASSVRACKHALDLCERLGIATGGFDYAANRCCRGALFTGLDVSCALDGVHVFELKDGGPDVEELLGTGALSDLVSARNDLCMSVSAMLDEMLPQCISAAPHKGRTSAGSVAGPEKLGARKKPRRRGKAAVSAPAGKPAAAKPKAVR